MIWDMLTTPILSEGEVVIPHDLYKKQKIYWTSLDFKGNNYGSWR